MQNRRGLLFAAGVSGMMLFLVFVFHYSFPSMVNGFRTAGERFFHYPSRIAHQFFDQVYTYHLEHPAFAARPLTSWLMDAVHRTFDVTYANSFLFVNFLLLFFCGVILYMVSREWRATHREGIASILVFYSSFTVLYAFFSPIYTYDEPAQYVLLFLTLLFLTKKLHLLAGASFFGALIARETSVFLIPALLILFVPHHKTLTGFFTQHRTAWRAYVSLLLPVLFYAIFMYWYMSHIGMAAASEQYLTAERFSHIAYNFKHVYFGIESVLSLIFAIGIPVFMLSRWVRHRELDLSERKRLLAFLVISAINIPIVFLSARAQEARLFSLPLIVMWPVLGVYMVRLVPVYSKQLMTYGQLWQMTQRRISLLFHLLLWLSIISVLSLFIWYVYTPMTSGNFSLGYQWYAQIMATLIAIPLFLDSYPRPTKSV